MTTRTAFFFAGLSLLVLAAAYVAYAFERAGR